MQLSNVLICFILLDFLFILYCFHLGLKLGLTILELGSVRAKLRIHCLADVLELLLEGLVEPIKPLVHIVLHLLQLSFKLLHLDLFIFFLFI